METSETRRLRRLFQHADIVRERPLLFVVLTAFLFAIMAFGATAFTGAANSAGSIEAHLHAELIDIDRSATTPANLVKPRPFDQDSLADFLLKDESLNNSAKRQSAEGKREEMAVTFEPGDEEGLIMTLSGVDNPENLVDSVNDRINAFFEKLNLERVMQREFASSLMDRFGSVWQSKVDEAKSAISLSPIDASSTSGEDPFKTERLLQLMIDATAKAKENLEVKGTGSEVIEDASTEMVSLTTDVTRLTSAMADLEARHAIQLQQVKALKNAEDGLARHVRELETVQASDSLLNRPAAVILSPVAVKGENGGFWKTGGAIWVAMLALSLFLAFLGTAAANRFQAKPAQTNADTAEMFNNPNWPLPPGAVRDL